MVQNKCVISAVLERMNRIKRLAHLCYVVLSILRALAIAIVTTCIWNDIAPHRHLLNLIIGLCTFLAIIRFSSLKRNYRIGLDAFLMGLDIQYPGVSQSPYKILSRGSDFKDWESRILREEKRIRAWESRRLITLSGSLLVPILLAILLFMKSPIDVANAINDAKNVVSVLSGGMTLEVLQGGVQSSEQEKNSHILSTLVSTQIELKSQNLVRIRVVDVDPRSDRPFIRLKPTEALESELNIQMVSMGTDGGRQGSVWEAEFSVDRNSDLMISTAGQKPVASFVVSSPPIPKVKLQVSSAIKDPWPDQELLPLNIEVTSEHALERIDLQILYRGQKRTEKVVSVSSSSKRIVTNYSLNLSQHLEDDNGEFEIYATALDKNETGPQTGRSQSIRLRVASGYGRYRQTLERLRDVKGMMDDARANGSKLSENLVEKMSKVLQLSDDSPFFDNIDRSELEQFRRETQGLGPNPTALKLSSLSEQIGQFLIEHEIIDDRERDRDFFIAVRILSRNLEKLKNGGQNFELNHLFQKTTQFLEERHKRWVIRVDRLGAGQEPKSWQKVSAKPFISGLKEVQTSSAKDLPQALVRLNQVASEYRSWIEELEIKEDQLKAKQEQERQQNISNAREELREIQQRQDQISTGLDRADQRKQDDLRATWSHLSPNQGQNSKQARTLLNKLRTASPTAGERLEAAIESMDLSKNLGDAQKWVDGEAASDLAGRLLRDADQAASKSQKQKDRGRRRKPAGDDFFGTVIGGQIELKSKYQVDPRYREQILNEVSGADSSSEDGKLLDSWLRQVVR